MILYVVGIAIALGFAALLWRRRQQKGTGWQREVTFFVDLLALSATALIVGVLAMVQLATPTQPTSDGSVAVAPAEPTEALDGRGSDDFILPEIIEETTPPVDPANEPQPPTEVIPDATESVTEDATPTSLPLTDTTPTSEITPTTTVGFITVTPSVGTTVETTSTVTATREATTTSAATSGAATPTVRATSTPRPSATALVTATPEPTLTPAPTATPTTRIHTVVSGDTLIEIAAFYGVSTADILAANPGINADSLRIGDQLIIPAAGSAPPPPPAPATQTYTIRAGDTLGSIANRFNTTVAELQRLNPGIDPTRMRVGSTIQVPA